MEEENKVENKKDNENSLNQPEVRKDFYHWGGQVWDTLFPQKRPRFIDPRFNDIEDKS